MNARILLESVGTATAAAAAATAAGGFRQRIDRVNHEAKGAQIDLGATDLRLQILVDAKLEAVHVFSNVVRTRLVKSKRETGTRAAARSQIYADWVFIFTFKIGVKFFFGAFA